MLSWTVNMGVQTKGQSDKRPTDRRPATKGQRTEGQSDKRPMDKRPIGQKANGQKANGQKANPLNKYEIFTLYYVPIFAGGLAVCGAYLEADFKVINCY